MLDLRFVRENIELITEKMAERGEAFDPIEFLHWGGERKRILQQLEALRAERNRTSEQVAALKKEGKGAGSEIARMKEVSDRIKELDEEEGNCERKLQEVLLQIPNLPHASVPRGRSSEDNQEVRRWGVPPSFRFDPKPHWEIGDALEVIDLGRATKIAGARFPLLKGRGALLERALSNFMLDLHTQEHGYIEIFPPLMVNRASMIGTGQLPKFEADLFRTTEEDLFLIPTAEVPVTNIHRDEILDGKKLPLKYAAYTPCFRREAGSYGKDTRGLIRQHQFNKVELVKFTAPEDSYEELERLLQDAEKVLQRLGIPYRVVVLCVGDLGFAAAKTYDIEVWLPSQRTFREISSCSNFEDFQARRAGIRYRPGSKGKLDYVHTLNGSGLAVGRTLVAILENFQQSDGSVVIPEALRPYMGGLERIVAP
ncbi:MAG: serine--tRNA ligase [bacterium]